MVSQVTPVTFTPRPESSEPTSFDRGFRPASPKTDKLAERAASAAQYAAAGNTEPEAPGTTEDEIDELLRNQKGGGRVTEEEYAEMAAQVDRENKAKGPAPKSKGMEELEEFAANNKGAFNEKFKTLTADELSQNALAFKQQFQDPRIRDAYAVAQRGQEQLTSASQSTPVSTRGEATLASSGGGSGSGPATLPSLGQPVATTAVPSGSTGSLGGGSSLSTDPNAKKATGDQLATGQTPTAVAYSSPASTTTTTTGSGSASSGSRAVSTVGRDATSNGAAVASNGNGSTSRTAGSAADVNTPGVRVASNTLGSASASQGGVVSGGGNSTTGFTHTGGGTSVSVQGSALETGAGATVAANLATPTTDSGSTAPDAISTSSRATGQQPVTNAATSASDGGPRVAVAGQNGTSQQTPGSTEARVASTGVPSSPITNSEVAARAASGAQPAAERVAANVAGQGSRIASATPNQQNAIASVGAPSESHNDGGGQGGHQQHQGDGQNRKQQGAKEENA